MLETNRCGLKATAMRLNDFHHFLSRVRYKVGPTEGSSHMQTEKPCTNSEISRFSMLVFGVGVEFGETADLAPADLQNCDLCQYY